MAFTIESLNDVQQQAVTYGGDKHCLILAGAGSGKTRVLTHRIAWLVSHGIPSWSILAITFTNKAAREMRERACKLLPDNDQNVILSTFHSFGARFLRQYADYIGLEKSFSIYSESEQKTLIKSIMTQHGLLKKSDIEKAQTESEIKSDNAAVSDYMNEIMSWKEKAVYVEDARKQAVTRKQDAVVMVYEEYEKQLIANNAVDFAGLLLWPLYVLSHYPNVREKIHHKYRHILVDEFQDTNSVQLQLLDLLCGPDCRLTVVGDDDQSIYTWRGADPKAILEFSSRFGACEVFKLEQNYRSTKPILTCAGNLIACNKIRTEKRLWTDFEGGEKVKCLSYPNDWEEASGTIATIKRLKDKNNLAWRDFAILYRKNSQSVVFERECTQKSIPYQVVGSVGFFEREEIVDLMAYLRILVNPSDRVALKRVINKPARGIGDKTCDKIIELLDKKALLMKDDQASCLKSLLEDIMAEKCKLPRAGSKVISGCRDFYKLLNRVDNWKTASPRDTLNAIIDESKYLDFLHKSTAKKGQEFEEAEERIKSLLQMMDIYQEEHPNDLAGFIEEMTLVRPDDDDEIAALNLMTIHSAKGLEFEVVFIVGVEEGVLPLERGGTCDIEEERRLMYVAMTRAKRVLYITHAEQRHEYGRMTLQDPSRFFDEMKRIEDAEIIEDIHVEGRSSLPFGSSRPQLAWSKSTLKPEMKSPRTSHDYADEVGGGMTRSFRSKHAPDEDFIGDQGYEEDAIDIYDDITQPISKSYNSKPSHPITSHTQEEKLDMTASNNAAVTVAKDKNGKKIQIGSSVMHAVHGKGTVVKIEKTGNDCKVYVNFAKGQRTIIGRFLVRI